MTPEPQHWTVDKRVPFALIVTMAAQTIAIVITFTIWMTNVNNRLEALEKSATATPETRVVIIEQKLGFIETILRRIEGKIDGRDPEPRK